MHGLAVYVKKGPPFARDLPQKRLLIFLTGLTSLLFPLSITFVAMHGFDSISSKIDEVLLINPSTNVLVF